MKYLYGTDTAFRHALDNTVGNIHEGLKAQLGSEAAARLTEQLAESKFTPDCGLPIYFSLSRQAAQLSETYYRAILGKHRDAMSGLNKLVFSD